MLATIMNLVSRGGGFLGAAIIVIGGITLGLGIREGGGGAKIASGIGAIVGGALIVAVSVYFGTLDTSWAS
jgi:hypothetical protein